MSEKIRILYLQENHCGECNYRDKEFQYCVPNCEVGQELNKLYEKGLEYPVIAKILGCHINPRGTNSMRREKDLLKQWKADLQAIQEEKRLKKKAKKKE